MSPYLLVPVVALLVTTAIAARLRGRKSLFYAAKPLSSLAVLFTAFLSLQGAARPGLFVLGVTIALILSLGGDVALMFDRERPFMVGLALFLVAHGAYSAAFTSGASLRAWDLLATVVVAAVGAAFYGVLSPGLGSMRFPVAAYTLVILLMLERATATLWNDSLAPRQSLMILVGAVLFVISDMMLAWDRFKRRFRMSELGLAAYYAGQLLIALSLRP